MRFYRTLVIATAPLVVACAGTLPKAQTSMYANGTYEFFEHPQGITTDLNGRLAILGDSVALLDASPACFENRSHALAARLQEFTCGDYSLTASRETGRWEFRYATKRTTSETVETCISWDTVAGRQVCKATTKEHHEHVIPLTGRLRLTAVLGAPAPPAPPADAP